jgi:uncharacterized caspase-like protein
MPVEFLQPNEALTRLLAVICRGALFVASALFLPAASALAQQHCGAGRDFMVQALERVKTGSPGEVENGLQLLKHAVEVCAGLGDAWYYRSLFERKLNQPAKADYALHNAQKYRSDAMEEGIDPFSIATDKPAPPSKVPSGLVRRKWALIIGISQFADGKIPQLNYPAKDAKDFAALLDDPQVGRFNPDNVRVLLNADATTKEIKAGLNWLARSAQPDDLVVVFIASHGSPREMDTRNVNYIVTNDTEIGSQDQLFATALAMVEVTGVIRSRIQARRTLVLLDTCHSGAAAGGRGLRLTQDIGESSVGSETLDIIRQGFGRAIITSSQAGQQSYESDDVKNGYFTYYLVQALRNSQGKDSIDKVYNYVREQVSSSVATKFRAQQTPVLSQSDRGAEIILGTPEAGDSATSSVH